VNKLSDLKKKQMGRRDCKGENQRSLRKRSKKRKKKRRNFKFGNEREEGRTKECNKEPR
jgi:hypothetical protein